MADVFLSYSKSERPQTQSLAQTLEDNGYSVWWDTSLITGDDYVDIILQQLDNAKAVVVIWTPTSVRSRWVRSEAGRADATRKLVPVSAAGVGTFDIPPPYDVLQTTPISDVGAIMSALDRLGAKRTATIRKQVRDRVAPLDEISDDELDKAIELEYWRAIERSEKIADFTRFKQRFPHGALVDLAERRMEALEAQEWSAIANSRSPDLLRDYLSKLPDGSHASTARELIDELETRGARQLDVLLRELRDGLLPNQLSALKKIPEAYGNLSTEDRRSLRSHLDALKASGKTLSLEIEADEALSQIEWIETVGTLKGYGDRSKLSGEDKQMFHALAWGWFYAIGAVVVLALLYAATN